MTYDFKLPNGLQVIHQYTPSASMAVVNLLYMVGSRDERPDHTGLAHLFEHLMFGGSVNIPDYDAPLQEAGGISNAWTSTDFTCFYNLIPAHNIETALWLESDRMLSLAFSEKALEVQRSVVVEEFKQVCINRPYGDTSHRLYALAYPPESPYRNPVIGRSFADIEKTTQEDVRNWFFNHYAPNNAILSIVGNIEPDRLKALVEEWFGDIPARTIAPRRQFTGFNPTPTPGVTPQLNLDLPAGPPPPQTAITLAFPMAAYGQPGYIEADLITDLLANGNSSRFYRRLLLPGKIFTEIDASITGFELPGLLLINAKLINNGPEAEAEALDAIHRELHDLATTPVAPDELNRVINRYESNRIFSNLSPIQRAQSLAINHHHGETEASILAGYRAVTPDAILATAATLFSPTPYTLITRPSSNP